jgi:hypothetical protein
MFENSLRFLKTAIMELADYLLYVIWNNSINILIDNSCYVSLKLPLQIWPLGLKKKDWQQKIQYWSYCKSVFQANARHIGLFSYYYILGI